MHATPLSRASRWCVAVCVQFLGEKKNHSVRSSPSSACNWAASRNHPQHSVDFALICAVVAPATVFSLSRLLFASLVCKIRNYSGLIVRPYSSDSVAGGRISDTFVAGNLIDSTRRMDRFGTVKRFRAIFAVIFGLHFLFSVMI